MGTILLTGGAGFIGSHVAERLSEEAQKVIILDNFDDYYNPEIKRSNIARICSRRNVKLIEGSIGDETLLDRLFEDHRIDIVVHLAAKAGVRNSIEHPQSYFETNVLGTANLLEGMRKHTCGCMVLASSSSVYGSHPPCPFCENEDLPVQLSPYALSKRMDEELGFYYQQMYGIHVWCLRFFTVYGPRQRPDMAIAGFLRIAANHGVATIYGDGTMQRDFTYIDDIVDGVCTAAHRVRGYEVINLGGSHAYSVNELVDTIERVTGKRLIKTYTEKPPGDVPVTLAEPTKAYSLLGFHAKIGLEEGIERQWEWYRAHPYQ